MFLVSWIFIGVGVRRIDSSKWILPHTGMIEVTPLGPRQVIQHGRTIRL